MEPPRIQARFGFLRHHPGIVVLNTGAWSNTDDLLGGITLMFETFRVVRIGAKPPLRNDLYERRLVVSSQLIYLENAEGQRFDVYPALTMLSGVLRPNFVAETLDSRWRRLDLGIARENGKEGS